MAIQSLQANYMKLLTVLRKRLDTHPGCEV